MVSLQVNGQSRTFNGDSDMPLLWYLRDELGLTGTKFGCGIAECGACTVHLDGQAVRSCATPMSAVANRKVTTIEGLSADGTHPVQKAWMEINVPQCGYCQAGQIMNAAALLNQKKNPTEREINDAMAGNICRCGCYQRITAAVKSAITGA
jgi:isoquinoline 1-oxidoreductase subunit alpha